MARSTFFKICGGIVYVGLLLVVSMKLFFEPQFEAFILRITTSEVERIEILRIGLTEPLLTLNPLANDSGSRTRLLHIYEPLIRVGTDLSLEPALAISYGSLDDTTWEFRIRSSVFFHDGAPLTIDDVIFSLLQSKENPASDVQDLMVTVKEVKKIDDQTLHIITDKPDPLLLSKISTILIFKKNFSTYTPIGTGPYVYERSEGDTIFLKKFLHYWGVQTSREAAFDTVVLKTLDTKEEKTRALEQSEVEVLAQVPVSVASNFAFTRFQLKKRPSMEVNFLMFHFDEIFKDRGLREAVSLALNSESLIDITQGYAMPVNQFVISGIFGYDPTIPKREYDPDKARALVEQYVGKGNVLKVTLDLPRGLDVFGSRVKDQLKDISIDLTLNFLAPSELAEKIASRQSDFFFFGWRTDLGDASTFLTAVVHSPTERFGQFNGGNYHSPEIDKVIEASQSTVDPAERIELLRAAMRQITTKDLIGVPLFSPEILYAVSRQLRWTPRVDGHILAQEIKL